MTLDYWKAAGAAVIDADQLAHETLIPNTPTWQEVIQTFGTKILNKDETINRPRLGRIVFADKQKLEALNRIIHPAVEKMWMKKLDELNREGQAKVAIVAIPLLYEVAADVHFDSVVVVGCSEGTQLARLKRKGFKKEEAVARVRAQWPLPMKMDRADFVIWNDGQLPVLHRQAEEILANIKETYAASKN